MLLISLQWGAMVQAWCHDSTANSHPTRASQTIQSGCEYDYPPFCLVGPDSQADGFSIELLRAALRTMGHDVVFKVGPWSQIKVDLARGDLQVLPLVGRTPEREEKFDFTFPYLKMHGTIVVRSDETRIRSLGDLKGRQVAVMRGDNAEEFIRRSNLDAAIVTTPTFEEALEGVSKGMHDAVVIQKLVALQLIHKLAISNLRMVEPSLEAYSQSFCFAVREGDKEMLSILNEGLALVMADGTFRRLQAKWFAPLEAKGRNRIVVGGDRSYPPYEYLDKNGNPLGYNVELTRVLAAQMGVDVEFRLGSWAGIRRKLMSGEIDVMHGMFYSPDRDSSLQFSVPHTMVQHVFVVRADSSLPKGVRDLEGKSVLVMDSDIMHDMVLDWGLEDHVVTTETQEDALRLLALGKHDCALVAKMPALYWINERKWTNLRMLEWPELTAEYCYSVLHGNEALLGRFETALAEAKNSGAYRRIHTKWFGVYEGDSELRRFLRYALYAVGVVLLLFAVAMIWSRILQKRVVERTAELRGEIADRQRLQDQLRQSQKLEAIGQLAGGIAHDFNNQLGGIVGHAELLRHKVEGRAELVRHADSIIQGSMNASKLTDQLLAFARKGKYLNTPVNLHKAIAEVVSILNHSIDKRIAIKQFLNAEAAVIMGDPSQIQNALLNIAINARDAMPEGGTLTFSTDLIHCGGSAAKAPLASLPEGAYIRTSVSDTGTGMDAAILERIFEPFFTTKRLGMGTGMGLASVYGTVENHGGVIDVDTKVGVGSTFHLWFPVAEVRERPESAQPSLLRDTGKGRILVVDDEAEIRTITSEMLRDLGYKVVTSSNGKEAIEYYRQFGKHVDLVIMDMMMPEMSGRDAILALQEMEPGVKAVLCSGYSLDRETKAILAEGSVQFLHKPFRAAALADTVGAALKEESAV